LFNPAAAGHGGHGKLVFKHRSQWVGAFNGEEPVTQILTFDTRFKNKFKNLGIGAILFNDQTGPSSRRGLELAYSYKLKLGSSGAKLSLGMSGMFLQYNIDFDALQTEIRTITLACRPTSCLKINSLLHKQILALSG